jgi:hypothetical protein
LVRRPGKVAPALGVFTAPLPSPLSIEMESGLALRV